MNKKLQKIFLLLILLPVGIISFFLSTPIAQAANTTCVAPWGAEVNDYTCTAISPIPPNCTPDTANLMTCKGAPDNFTTDECSVDGSNSFVCSDTGTFLKNQSNNVCLRDGVYFRCFPPTTTTGCVTNNGQPWMTCPGVPTGYACGATPGTQCPTIPNPRTSSVQNPEQSSTINPATYNADGTVVNKNLTYIPLEPLPGIPQDGSAKFSEVVAGLFRILLNIGVLVGVAALTFGGISYMTSDAVGKKALGKERIQAAMWGLIILGFSYLLLFIINPQLVTFNKILDPAGAYEFIPTPAPSPGPLHQKAIDQNRKTEGLVANSTDEERREIFPKEECVKAEATRRQKSLELMEYAPKFWGQHPEYRDAYYQTKLNISEAQLILDMCRELERNGL